MKKTSSADQQRAARLARQRHAKHLKRKLRSALVRKVGRDRVPPPPPNRFAFRIKSPQKITLSHLDNGLREETLDFFADILDACRKSSGKPILVDMLECEGIDINAALALTATLEIANQRHPGMIDGVNPRHNSARSILWAVGFHTHLKYLQPFLGLNPMSAEDRMVVEMRSGGIGPHSGIRMPNAAAALSEVWSDMGGTDLLRNRIQSAINEALLNVLNHAYTSANPSAAQSLDPPNEHRWWALGIVDKQARSFDLIVLDRGVGIQRTLIPSMIERAKTIFSGVPEEEARLSMALEYGTTSREGSGGKGLPEMIRLIDDFPGSFVLVESLRALYLKKADMNAATEHCFSTRSPTEGTLIWWSLNLGTVNAGHEASD